ncbi:MAG: hypothetical protein IJ277_04480 [Bacteroidaceae bacterium]|nr:hypothetical protein [Bacteroidaceae bacterium]
MHKFYITNNLGGGGTNVSRLYDYLEKFELDNIGILLNYYYLTGSAKTCFDLPLIKQIDKFDDANDFVNFCREYFKAKRYTSSKFQSSNSKISINGFILDNGCGNFLRDLLEKDNSHDDIHKKIKFFLDFAEQHKFELSVSLDLAMKYTYKASEKSNPIFMYKWQELANDDDINFELLSKALQEIKLNGYKHSVLAPLHGFDYESFIAYLERIIDLENTIGTEFSGFALGGIANTRVLDNDFWGIPRGFTKNLKSAYICYNLVKRVREKTSRHIHVLGAGNIYILPFLVYAGANSSDCHSAWRRSSDGGLHKAKILVPLLDDKFNFINKKNCLEYVRIKDISDGDYRFNCGYSIKEIQELLTSPNKEDFYFAEIIIFLEAILQYDILIKFIKANTDNYIELLINTPDKNLNTNYLAIKKALKI